ncbi:MAG: DUF302 domain-containing protein [Gammaproteobacteria bacterium]|nr:DUF302 domain-containing protein [Gammaproteobacteria bacterium]
MYEFNVELPVPFDEAQSRVREALLGEQFGIVSEIDVQAVFKAKMAKDIPPYRILGACNPGLADRILAAEPNAGALLPCNVVVRDAGGGRTVVSFMDPEAVLGLSAAPAALAVAAEAKARLGRVAAKLAG